MDDSHWISATVGDGQVIAQVQPMFRHPCRPAPPTRSAEAPDPYVHTATDRERPTKYQSARHRAIDDV